MTIGAERPPYGAFQARLSPDGDHFTGKFFSLETPSRAGPRQSAQSLAATTVTIRQMFKIMEISLVIFGGSLELDNEVPLCNLEDVYYVSSRCYVTYFPGILAGSIRSVNRRLLTD